MKRIIYFLFLLLNFSACSKTQNQVGAVMQKKSYISVSMSDGIKLMQNDSNFILLDVRRPDEFLNGHIPGAVLLTNETISEESASELLKDKNQKIYVYCRSGRRSKEASQKLSDLGYKNIIEIGGILDYKGEVEY